MYTLNFLIFLHKYVLKHDLSTQVLKVNKQNLIKEMDQKHCNCPFIQENNPKLYVSINFQ